MDANEALENALYALGRSADEGVRLYWYCGDITDFRPCASASEIPTNLPLDLLTTWFEVRG